MKKGLILMSLLMAATGGFARTLTPEEALQRVKNDNGMKRALQSDASASPQLVQTVRTSAGMPAVYLFNRPEDAGYMLVSADDVAMPLLGYSDEPVAADGGLPPSMQWWMEQYALEIEQATAAGAPRFAEPADAVDAVASFTPVSPLCATRWNQDEPYNDMCPLINGKRTYTGCLATALAQVMKYYEWPERGAGSITYKDENGTARTMSFDVAFDWDAMLNEYGGNATAEQKNAVALLMKACGYSVKMTYGTQASGASDSYVVSALTSYFGYDSSARLCQRYNYGLAEWQSMIYDNLKNIGPVLYCGSSPFGGHAFVCDGYSADGYYHFNWGWGGDYDGYFLLTSLNPEGQGIGGYAGGYNLFQSIVLGVRKPGGTPVNIPLQLSQSEVLTGNVTGNWLSLTGGWYNETGSSMRMALGIKVEPVEGSEGGTIYVDSRDYVDITLENGYGWKRTSFQFDISGVPDGTYKVSMVTKNTALPAQGWTPTLCRMNQAGYVILKKGAVSTVSSVNPGVLDVSSASLLTGLYINGYAKLNMSVANNSEFEVAEALVPALRSGNSLVAMGAGIYFDLLPGESSDRDLVFQFAYTKAFKTNTNYTLCLLNPETYEVRHIIGTVKVLDDPGTLRLSATSFALEGGTTAVDCGKNLRFTADVKCLAGYMAMPVSVAVTPKDGGATLAYGYSSEPLFIEVGQTASAEISLPFSEGVPGTTYTAYLCYEDDNVLNPLRSMTFTVGTAGVEPVTAAGNGIEISYDRASRRARVSAAAGVKAVKAFSATGAELAVPVEMTGNNAVLDFSNAGTGIVIVTAVDAAGESETAKFVL